MPRHSLCGVIAACLISLTSSALRADEFSFQEVAGDHLDVLRDGKVVVRYMTAYDKSTPERLAETYKPFLHVFDPAGQAPITKGPGGEFTHHRGIFIGWMKIGVNGKSYDRWHMKGGEQVHEKFLAKEAGPGKATFTSLVKWFGEGSDVLLEEERTFTITPAAAPWYVSIDATSTLKAVAGDTLLDGDPEHAGLQYRPANELDKTKTTYIFSKADADAHKDVDYAWAGETYWLGDKAYSVAYLNHPANPKETRFSAYRDYGRFGGFFKTSIPKDGTLTLKVRFLIGAGDMPSAELIQKGWNAFTGQEVATPATTVKLAEMPAKK